MLVQIAILNSIASTQSSISTECNCETQILTAIKLELKKIWRGEGGVATSTTERAATRKQTLFRKPRFSPHEIIKPKTKVKRRQDEN